MATRVRSFSKVNLGLAIGPARADGFHGLTTIYQTLALYDLVTVTARLARATSIRLTTNHPYVPRDGRNTAWKMVERCLARFGVAAEVAIDINKRLPVQGGMGAGSANAAAALLGLERELGVALGERERLEIAAEVGSDVPLFLVGGAVLGTGRGEQVMPLNDMPVRWCVVAVPGVGVSTPQAFRDWDALVAKGLTFERGHAKLVKLSFACFPSPNKMAASSDDMSVVWDKFEFENDFEQVIFPQHTSLAKIKACLVGRDQDKGLAYAALSGSGSALFGLYRSKAAAEAAQQRVQASGVKALLTATLPRAEYWRTMFAG